MTTLDQIHALEPRLRNAVRNDDLHAQETIARSWLTLIQQAQMDAREIESMRAMSPEGQNIYMLNKMVSKVFNPARR